MIYVLKIIAALLPSFIQELIPILKSKERSIEHLKSHDIFTTLIRVRNEVANLKFYSKGEYDRVKTKMCNDFTKHKITKCSERIGNLLKIRGLSSMSRDELKTLILEEQNNMHTDYVRSVSAEWEMKGIKPEDVDHVIHLFEKFRYDVLVSFEHRVNSIFGSSYNKDNFSLMLAVLEMWAMGIDLFPRDMHTTFESLNGKFKELEILM